MVEETTAAAHSLSQQTDDLSSLISRFQIGQNAAGAAGQRNPSKSAYATRRALKVAAHNEFTVRGMS